MWKKLHLWKASPFSVEDVILPRRGQQRGHHCPPFLYSACYQGIIQDSCSPTVNGKISRHNPRRCDDGKHGEAETNPSLFCSNTDVIVIVTMELYIKFKAFWMTFKTLSSQIQNLHILGLNITLKFHCHGVRIKNAKASLFPVGVGLHQHYALSPILLVIFMARISRCRWGLESVQYDDIRATDCVWVWKDVGGQAGLKWRTLPRCLVRWTWL